MSDDAGSGDALRIDRWLWGARFFKSRSVAAEEVKAGHVRLNSQRVKPAREVRAGDRLTVVKGATEIELDVVALPARRGPAAEAKACYLETEASVARREARRAEGPRALTSAPPTSGRPDKRTRRLIRSRIRDRLSSD